MAPLAAVPFRAVTLPLLYTAFWLRVVAVATEPLLSSIMPDPKLSRIRFWLMLLVAPYMRMPDVSTGASVAVPRPLPCTVLPCTVLPPVLW